MKMRFGAALVALAAVATLGGTDQAGANGNGNPFNSGSRSRLTFA